MSTCRSSSARITPAIAPTREMRRTSAFPSEERGRSTRCGATRIRIRRSRRSRSTSRSIPTGSIRSAPKCDELDDAQVRHRRANGALPGGNDRVHLPLNVRHWKSVRRDTTRSGRNRNCPFTAITGVRLPVGTPKWLDLSRRFPLRLFLSSLQSQCGLEESRRYPSYCPRIAFERRHLLPQRPRHVKSRGGLEKAVGFRTRESSEAVAVPRLAL